MEGTRVWRCWFAVWFIEWDLGIAFTVEICREHLIWCFRAAEKLSSFMVASGISMIVGAEGDRLPTKGSGTLNSMTISRETRPTYRLYRRRAGAFWWYGDAKRRTRINCRTGLKRFYEMKSIVNSDVVSVIQGIGIINERVQAEFPGEHRLRVHDVPRT